jgi:AraC-like DNA-binding protein
MHPRYQQFRPIEAFRPLVDAYWVNRPGAAPFDRVLPDGCIDLVFRGGVDDAALFSSALVERPIFLNGGNSAWFAGVRFRPAMARAILDIEPVDCRDRDIPAGAFDARFRLLEEELQECASPEQALAVLQRAVDARLAQGAHRIAPARVREALRLLARGGNHGQVHGIARALGIAERSLHRDLKRWSGLAPKSMARILRMQRTMKTIRAGGMPLAGVALQMGYADQAHMTRELKSLTGFTPAEIAPRIFVRNLQDARPAPPYVSSYVS